MTVKRLLPVIALFRFNYIFGNDIQRHTHHDNLSNHSKIQKIIGTCEYVIVFSKAKPKKNVGVCSCEKMPARSRKVLLWVLKKKREIQGPLQIRLN